MFNNNQIEQAIENTGLAFAMVETFSQMSNEIQIDFMDNLFGGTDLGEDLVFDAMANADIDDINHPAVKFQLIEDMKDILDDDLCDWIACNREI